MNPRYKVEFTSPNIWHLQISAAELTDAGRYNCTVNSDPPISQSVYITVEGMSNLIKNLLTDT